MGNWLLLFIKFMFKSFCGCSLHQFFSALRYYRTFFSSGDGWLGLVGPENRSLVIKFSNNIIAEHAINRSERPRLNQTWGSNKNLLSST